MADTVKLAKEKLQEIDEADVDLTEWEMSFVSDLIDRDPDYLSDKQIEQIDRIWKERLR